MRRTFCDRCEKVCNDSDGTSFVEIVVDSGGDTEDTFVDLCPECMEKLKAFLNIKKNESFPKIPREGVIFMPIKMDGREHEAESETPCET